MKKYTQNSKTVKKALTVIMSLVLALTLVACGGQKETNTINEAASADSASTEDEVVAEETKPEEGTEDVFEEPVSDNIPTSAADIWEYMNNQDNVKAGDTMLSEDDVLFVALPGYTMTDPADAVKPCRPYYCAVKMIDGEAYAVAITRDQLNAGETGTYLEYAGGGDFEYGVFPMEALDLMGQWANQEAVQNEFHDSVTDEFDKEMEPWYVRVEPTGNADRVKVIIKAEDAQWFYDHFVEFALQAKMKYGILDAGAKGYFFIPGEYSDPLYVEYDRFEGDTITFYADPATLVRFSSNGLVQKVNYSERINLLEVYPDLSGDALTAGLFGKNSMSYSEPDTRNYVIDMVGFIYDTPGAHTRYVEPEYEN